jgi:hypothetical protein
VFLFLLPGHPDLNPINPLPVVGTYNMYVSSANRTGLQFLNSAEIFLLELKERGGAKQRGPLLLFKLSQIEIKD